MRELRAVVLLALALLGIPRTVGTQPLTVLDVPFVAQSELLCGGAAAAMVMRYWGERGIDSESFTTLIDANAGGITTAALTADIRNRGWSALSTSGSADGLAREVQRGRPVIALIEERRDVFHYVVIVAEGAGRVVFHDPARVPFRIATIAEFDKRWAPAGRWMLVVTPENPRAGRPLAPPVEADRAAGARPADTDTGSLACDRLVADGVREAQAADLAAAERTLVSALSCPGPAALRELAGLRVLQRRWPEVVELAAAAVARDPSDTYGWKTLATARLVMGERLNALDAWNQAGEPRVDLVRIDGLTRTRYAVVQQLIGVKTGDLLTRATLVRGRRRLGDLPSIGGSGAVVDFRPLPSGLAEVQGVISERRLAPRGWLDLAVLSFAAAATRELTPSISSPTGGGERFSVDWRFWRHRPLYQLSFAAPIQPLGTWRLTVFRERQPFTAVFPRSLHDSAQVDVGKWLTGALRVQLIGGADRWNGSRTSGVAGAGARVVSADDRIDGRVQIRSWFGGGVSFRSGEALITLRSTAQPNGTVVVATGGIHAVTSSAPPDVWYAGDTGRARPLLLRAHPVLADGDRFRAERLGRVIDNVSTELQRWWSVGPAHVGAAMFGDAARTARRVTGPDVVDVDVGVGFRSAFSGRASLRVDLARGLRDGETALSVVYSP